ncbi:MAG: bifunctional YncE family protein/alkaline phosphatase family protein [Candidatus Velthaea sp.]
MKRTALVVMLCAGVAGAAALAQNGPTLLPNGWRIAAPPGAVAEVGTLPTGIVLSRDGAQAFVLESGYGQPALRVLSSGSLAVERTVALPNAFGTPLRDVGGDGVWVAMTATFGEQIAHVDTGAGRVDRTISLPAPFFASALARSPDGRTLAVAGDLAREVAFVDERSGELIRRVAVGRHPAALAFTADGATLYVAGRAERYVDAIDVRRGVVRKRIAAGLHPAALAIDGAALYVANADDDDLAAIDLRTESVRTRTPMPFAFGGLVGASPNALALAGDRVYVSCGAANAVAVFARTPGGLRPIGAIPTGWYPTAVAVERGGRSLLVADGKGESGHPNPGFRPNAARPPDYIAQQLTGSIRRVAIPGDAALHAGIARVRDLAPHAALVRHPVVRANGPIKHVIYVIKENRTYDQVLGDVPDADGDARLVMFGAAVTPNQHALVRRFGVFDRFFTDAHVSADGHNWSMGAFANDYLEKMWPPQYASRRPVYDFEDGAEAARPHSGYLWDLAARRHVTMRNYGEFVTSGPSSDGPVSTTERALAKTTDRRFPTFDMRVPDVARLAEWRREFDAYEAAHTLPALEILRFPRDHTAGTDAGENTPQAMVADNDLAVGGLIDALSHSADWPSTAVFVIEDDAQNGPDHIDEQRSTLYVVSPYAAAGTHHAHYATSSVLRTIEIVLGLPPLTPYDAGALPLYDAFTAAPNLEAFAALPAAIDVNAKNPPGAYGAAESARLDFTHADAVRDDVLNDILWHAIKGTDAALPAYGAFRAAASP